MEVTLLTYSIRLYEGGFTRTLLGTDMLSAQQVIVNPDTPNAPQYHTVVIKTIWGDEVVLDLRPGLITNQARWTNNSSGVTNCILDLQPIIRASSGGGGGGSVDSVIGGTGITVNSTDPANPIVGLSDMDQARIKGRASGTGTGAPIDLTAAQATAILNPFTTTLKGLVPAPTTATGRFLKDDGTWASAGAGDVTGPGSSVDGNITLFSGATGKVIQDSGFGISEIIVSSGFGDVQLIESSPGYVPIGLKDVKDGDGTTTQSNTGSFQINVDTKNSVEVDSAQVQLVGDQASPGNSQYYGTDSGGTKGFHALPSPGTGDVVGPASATDSVPALFDGTTGKLIKNSTPTGTGNPVLQTSPTLTTPDLGTPSAAVLTNATGLPTTGLVNSAVTFAKLQQLSARTMVTNNTGSTADASTSTFNDPGVQTFAETITWTAGAAPSGATNHTLNWTQVGNMVSYQIFLRFSVSGTTITGLSFPVPSGMPAPLVPSGVTGGNAMLYPNTVRYSNGTTGLFLNNSTGGIRRNSGDSATEFVEANLASGTYNTFVVFGQYWTA